MFIILLKNNPFSNYCESMKTKKQAQDWGLFDVTHVQVCGFVLLPIQHILFYSVQKHIFIYFEQF